MTVIIAVGQWLVDFVSQRVDNGLKLLKAQAALMQASQDVKAGTLSIEPVSIDVKLAVPCHYRGVFEDIVHVIEQSPGALTYHVQVLHLDEPQDLGGGDLRTRCRVRTMLNSGPAYYRFGFDVEADATYMVASFEPAQNGSIGSQ